MSSLQICPCKRSWMRTSVESPKLVCVATRGCCASWRRMCGGRMLRIKPTRINWGASTTSWRRSLGQSPIRDHLGPVEFDSTLPNTGWLLDRPRPVGQRDGRPGGIDGPLRAQRIRQGEWAMSSPVRPDRQIISRPDPANTSSASGTGYSSSSRSATRSSSSSPVPNNHA